VPEVLVIVVPTLQQEVAAAKARHLAAASLGHVACGPFFKRPLGDQEPVLCAISVHSALMKVLLFTGWHDLVRGVLTASSELWENMRSTFQLDAHTVGLVVVCVELA
jgi:hypothetical protein